jgi:hypothetical protein
MKNLALIACAAVAIASDLDRAYEALRNRDYDAAIPAFEEAIRAEPERADFPLSRDDAQRCEFRGSEELESRRRDGPAAEESGSGGGHCEGTYV